MWKIYVFSPLFYFCVENEERKKERQSRHGSKDPKIMRGREIGRWHLYLGRHVFIIIFFRSSDREEEEERSTKPIPIPSPAAPLNQFNQMDGHRYVNMQSDPPISRSHSFRQDNEWVFDELPNATIVSVSRPDASDISPVLLTYTIQFQYKQVRFVSFRFVCFNCIVLYSIFRSGIILF